MRYTSTFIVVARKQRNVFKIIFFIQEVAGVEDLATLYSFLEDLFNVACLGRVVSVYASLLAAGRRRRRRRRVDYHGIMMGRIYAQSAAQPSHRTVQTKDIRKRFKNSHPCKLYIILKYC